MTHLKTLSQHYRQFMNFYQTHYDHNYPVSQFWQSIFQDRQNFPEPNQLLTFQRGKFLTGVGKDETYTEAEEKKIWERYRTLVGKSVSPDYLSSLNEPIFGAPVFFEDEHCQMSTSYLLNTIHSYKINQIINHYGFKNPHIAEIGPGWGATAEQLLQTVKPTSYTIIDLPENLLLSSLYLSLSHPEYEHQFINEGTAQNKKINYTFPHLKEKLIQKYDVIINSFSFQEMELDTVKDYLSWCKNNLTENGIIISINSHNKTSLQEPANYLHPELQILKIESFRIAPPQLLNTVPYLLIMTKGVQNITAERLNQIGYLAQLGFNIDYMATLPDLEDFTQEKTIQPIFDGFKRLNEKDHKEMSMHLFYSEIHAFASLKLAFIAHIENVIKAIPQELIREFPWLTDEIYQFAKKKPKKALRRYLMTLLDPLVKKSSTKGAHVL